MDFVYEETIFIEVFLDEQRTDGKHWVAYDAAQPRLAKNDLICFSAIYDAKQYCFENSIGDEQFVYCTIDKMLQALDSAVKNVFRKNRNH
ncbi:hypothetical protein HNQ91_002984 [Filimonas zeae]|uniref:Uncharacterized protein n=1 Tax=Filimonas zeae TaxID=1737353 RepID=A0A917MYG0_9BACT|nr:hypothetical protein [Filimonas zeae]MDR6339919.1 hypothetical protein [Filimonas zeae]GGH70302.1 hypothetical protein GCM10011379_28430 [Filimonas zeae]